MTISPDNVEQTFLTEKEWYEDDPEKLAEQMSLRTEDLAIGINARELAFYVEKEVQTGQRWFPTSSTQIPWRYGYRFVYHWNQALPNTTSTSLAHGINNASAIKWFTNLYGVAVDNAGPTWLSLPNSSCDILADATNITLSTSSDLSAYDEAYIVMEYLKQD